MYPLVVVIQLSRFVISCPRRQKNAVRGIISLHDVATTSLSFRFTEFPCDSICCIRIRRLTYVLTPAEIRRSVARVLLKRSGETAHRNSATSQQRNATITAMVSERCPSMYRRAPAYPIQPPNISESIRIAIIYLP